MHPPHAPTQLGACFFMDVGLNPAICLHPRALANARAARTASSAYRSHNSLRVPRLSAATMRYVTACPALRMAARSGGRSPTPAGTGSTCAAAPGIQSVAVGIAVSISCVRELRMYPQIYPHARPAAPYSYPSRIIRAHPAGNRRRAPCAATACRNPCRSPGANG